MPINVDDAHGRSGNFHVRSSYDTKILEAFCEAAGNYGYPARDTGNGNAMGNNGVYNHLIIPILLTWV